jgi:cyanophycinase
MFLKVKSQDFLFTLFLIFIVLVSSQVTAQNTGTGSLTSGPEKGSLVIVGGAMKDTNIILKFMELAGGKDAPLIVVPTASGAETFDAGKVTRFLTRLGASHVTMVHTYKPEEANTTEFNAPIQEARGVWFTGGRQWRIVDAYSNTQAEEEFRKVLSRGGVIGGSSAGATIQGSFLARGDTKTNRIMMGDHQKGFGYLKNSAIDQHLLVRNRQFDLIEVIKAHPELLGIGLDENTAIIVKNNIFEVMGASFVAIYDAGLWGKDNNKQKESYMPENSPFFLLRSGDKYDMSIRRVVYWGGNNRSIYKVNNKK